MTKQQVRASIEAIGIIPAVRVSSAEDALFAAEEVARGGIPIVEVTMTVPGALEVVAELTRRRPEIIVGAGTVLHLETARKCLAAGAQFLTSTGLDLRIVQLAVEQDVLMLAGALTPTEVITAWKAGADMVKVFPCAQVGGPSYIRALKAPLPEVALIAAGGVNQRTAAPFIQAGASALGIGGELIPREAIRNRNSDWITELARRFLGIVKSTRSQMAAILQRHAEEDEDSQE